MSSLRRSLRWARRFPLPLWAGLGVVSILHLRRKLRGDQEPLSMAVYKAMPLRALSRGAGWVAEAQVPPWARPAVLGGYAKLFGCNLDEAECADVRQYESLGKLFRRRIKADRRAVDQDEGAIVSPCDGRILHHGKMIQEAGKRRIEQVKGVDYDLDFFLGEEPQLKDSNKNALFYVTVYLAPGDYHGFHSAVDTAISRRTHFSGLLLSVGPSIARKIPGLFNLNERVCYSGQWQHGYYSITAVGATNVGCVRVPFDKELATNEKEWCGGEKKTVSFPEPIRVQKGQYFGEFNMGSTIVLVYEAPKEHQFHVAADSVVKMGQSIAKTA